MFRNVWIRKQASIYSNGTEISIFGSISLSESDENQQRTDLYRYGVTLHLTKVVDQLDLNAALERSVAMSQSSGEV